MTPADHFEPALKAMGKKLHAFRKARKDSLETVARAVGITPSYLSRIEKGKCNYTLLVLGRLCDYYGVDPTDLLKGHP